MKKITILQYNVNKSKEATLAPLLRDPKLGDVDILAIQEPWINSRIQGTEAGKTNKTGYNPRGSNYYLIFPKKANPRVSLYISKNLDISSWSAREHTGDIQSVQIQYKPNEGEQTRNLQIWNVYNEPTPYSDRQSQTITDLGERMRTAPCEDRIVIGDFNLHHPLWNNEQRLTHHNSSEQLLDITERESMSLITPKGITTWRARDTQSTIDLCFASDRIENTIQCCKPREDLSQSSDHIPIETTIQLHVTQRKERKQRCWKKMDNRKLLEVLESSRTQNGLHTTEDIDSEATEITQTLQKAIEVAVPWARPSKWSKDWWTKECEEAVQEYRKAGARVRESRLEKDENQRKRARNQKVNVIRKAMRKAFR